MTAVRGDRPDGSHALTRQGGHPSAKGRNGGLAIRREIAPLRQGELDCLCAVYAAINAARLLLSAHGAPLSLAGSSRVYASSTERLARKGALHEALTWGVEQRRQLAIARHVAALVSSDSFNVSVERLAPAKSVVDQAFNWIEESLAASKPVMIRLIGAAGLDHFTVVSACTATTLHLFDSGTRSYIRKDSIGLHKGVNVIPASSMMRLALEPLG